MRKIIFAAESQCILFDIWKKILFFEVIFSVGINSQILQLTRIFSRLTRVFAENTSQIIFYRIFDPRPKITRLTQILKEIFDGFCGQTKFISQSTDYLGTFSSYYQCFPELRQKITFLTYFDSSNFSIARISPRWG